MWNKEAQAEVPGTSPSKDSRIPGAPMNATSAGHSPQRSHRAHPGVPGIDHRGEGRNHQRRRFADRWQSRRQHFASADTGLPWAHRALNSEINAREVIVYGNASGNLRARDRVEIKKDGQVIGDITTTRISIEEGAYFKGHIEIERAHSSLPREQGNRRSCRSERRRTKSTSAWRAR